MVKNAKTPPVKQKRCPNGSRRNKKTGNCEPTTAAAAAAVVKQKTPPTVAPRKTYRRKRIPILPSPTPSNKTTPKKAKVPSAIKAFFARAPIENQTRFLKAICSTAHYCTSFGRETDRIETFFGFDKFTHASTISMISSGGNGIVNEIIFNRNNYKASTVLKLTVMTASYMPDNIYIEAFNGINYINKFAQQFPCFIKTYGAYLMKPLLKRQLQFIERGKHITAKGLSKSLTPLPISSTYNAAASCVHTQDIAILLEHMHNPTTLSDLLKTIYTAPYRERNYHYYNTIPAILFQIYSVLAVLANAKMFTHYDLHMANVLLYEIPNGKHVIMRYKNAVDGNTIEFPTRYIVKIIDYGRCYLPDNAAIYKKVCETRICGPSCGEEFGYEPEYWGTNPSAYNHYITQQIMNQSRDMLAAVQIHKFLQGNSHIEQLLNKIDPFDYAKSGTMPAATTTTPKDYLSDLITSWPKIKNVEELYWALYHFILLVQKTGVYSIDKIRDHIGEYYGTMTVDLNYDRNKVRPLEFVVG